MMHRGIGFEAAQHWYLNRWRLADARQIVAKKVNDHDVLRAILPRGEKIFRPATVFVNVAGSGNCTLDRAGLDGPAIELEKALRRTGSDDDIPVVQESCEGRGIQRAEPAVQFERIELSAKCGAEPLRDVGLEDVACQNQVDDAFDSFHVGLAPEVRGPCADRVV